MSPDAQGHRFSNPAHPAMGQPRIEGDHMLASALLRIPLSVIVSVIRSFQDVAAEDVFAGRNTGAARRYCPRILWRVARRKLDALNQAAALRDLRAPPGNRLERLKGDRAGQHSIRINDQYRICFRWTDKGPEEVEIVDYH